MTKEKEESWLDFERFTVYGQFYEFVNYSTWGEFTQNLNDEENEEEEEEERGGNTMRCT